MLVRGDNHAYEVAPQDDLSIDDNEGPLNTAPARASVLRQPALYAAILFVVVGCATLLAFPASAPLESCLLKAGVPFLSKTSAGWSGEIVPQNLRLPYTPAAVAIPESMHHIQVATACGAKHKVRVSARGGGHSFGSFGLGGENGHLVISLENMRAVVLHTDNTATIQPGARLGAIATELHKQGRRAIAHGICPGVGIAGHVLHGGVGMSTRTHGLTLDWLIGAKVVLADGSLVHCSDKENQDLFWALRGAGSSFGIVAEFEFNTFEAPTDATRFTVKLSWDEDTAVHGIKALQDFATQAPQGFNLLFHMSNHSQFIDGIYYGDRHSFNQSINSLIQGTKGHLVYVNATEWIPALEHFAYGEDLIESTHDNRRAFYATSAITTTLGIAQIKALTSGMISNFNNASANHQWAYMMDLYGGNMSAVTNVNSSATSFVHRDKQLLHQFGTTEKKENPSAEAISMIEGFRKSFVESMTESDWGMYANYVDTQIDSDTARELYWGHNLQRLRQIKSRVDPGDVFWNPHGVRPE